MKKTYVEPANEIIKLGFKQSLMTISGNNGLTGTSYGGRTSEKVVEGDAREALDNPDDSEDWNLF